MPKTPILLSKEYLTASFVPTFDVRSGTHISYLPIELEEAMPVNLKWWLIGDREQRRKVWESAVQLYKDGKLFQSGNVVEVVADVQELSYHVELAQDNTDAVEIDVIALAEGTWNGRYYPADELPKFKQVPSPGKDYTEVRVNHKKDSAVGTVLKTWYEPEHMYNGKKIPVVMQRLKITNLDMVAKLRAKQIKAVSMGANVNMDYSGKCPVCRDINSYETSLMDDILPACSKCVVENGHCTISNEFDEALHPRDEDGKFTDGGGGGTMPGTGITQPTATTPNTGPTESNDAVFDRAPGERVAIASNMKKLERVGMDIERKRNPNLRFTSEPDGWADVKRMVPEKTQKLLGAAMHPNRFSVDAFDHEKKYAIEEKVYSKQAKDIKIKSGRAIDRRRKAMVANSMGYKLMTRLVLVNGKPEIYEMDGFKGARPHQMTRVE